MKRTDSQKQCKDLQKTHKAMKWNATLQTNKCLMQPFKFVLPKWMGMDGMNGE